MVEKTRIAIIGAGLTGLTTAYYLKKAGMDVTVFDRRERPGGVIETRNEKGFVYESGPNTGVLGHPEARELLDDLAPDCRIEIADQTAKARWIWKNGKWEPLPSGLLSAIRTPLFSFGDKLRLLGEPFRQRGANPDETLAEMVKRRMGASFLNYAVDPFILGIYAGDPGYLVTKYALPKLYNLEQNYGSFIRGAIKKRKEPKTERDKLATREVFSVEGGLGNLVRALVTRIGTGNIHLGCHELKVVAQSNGRFQVSRGNELFGHFAQVVTTIGAHALVQTISFKDENTLTKINCLQYARVIQVSVGFTHWEGLPLKAFGGLVPFNEKRDILGALFISSFLKNRAPQGGALLSVFLGGLRRPELSDLSDVQVFDTVEKELKEMLGLKGFNPDLFRTHRYEHAIPQYGKESAARLASIAKTEAKFPGLWLAGNIRDGIGMADRIRQGKMIADKIIQQP